MLPLLAVPSILKGVAGIADIFGGKKRARNNIRPVAQVNDNYIKNVALAEQAGRQGLPQQQYNLAQQNINRNQSVALNSLSRSANPAAGLQGLLRASNDATMGLDVQNANARMQNQRFAFGQRNNLAQDQQRVWNYNQAQKYNEEANAASQQIGSGKSNLFGSLTDLTMLGASMIDNKGQTSQDMAGNREGSNGYISTYNQGAQLQQVPTLSAGRVRNSPVALPKFTYR